MTVNTRVKDQSALNTQLAEETQLNPDVVGTPQGSPVNQSGNSKIVHITLIVDGVTFDASDVAAAIDGIAGYNLTGETTYETRNTYIWNLGPT